MSLRINTNISALNTHRNLSMTDLALSKSLEKLSSGMRVNRASDDAAGLSISETLRGQIRGLAQAEKNAQDGISLINTAEGALNEIHSILQRMRELAVQGANDTLTASDRNAISSEVAALSSEIDNIANYTSFNTKKLLDGTVTALTFQVGANANQTLKLTLTTATAASLTVTALSVTTNANANASITTIDAAIAKISTIRSGLGAVSNRLEHTINNQAISRENLTAAESRVRDVDMAEEMTNMTRNQILMQSGTAMLAQANMGPQSVLSLLN